MSLLSIQYRRMTTFVYVLLFLLVFNLLFNLNFQWYGLSIIVRVYLFVFSFYLIYNYSTIEIGRVKDLYRNRFGLKGDLLLLAEMGLVPIAIIYGITIAFTLIDYIRLANWPWNPILSLLNGRYSNLVIYSLFLFIILKTKRGPGIKIAVFIAVSTAYYFMDKVLFSVFTAGPAISVIKFSKFVVLFFFLFYGFLGERHKLRSLLYSIVVSTALLSLVVGGYFLAYFNSAPRSYQQNESGMVLMKFGFSFPVTELRRNVVEKKDIVLFREMEKIAAARGGEISLTAAEWEDLLFSGSMDTANYIAGRLMGRKIPVAYEKLADFAERKSSSAGGRLEGSADFITLTAKALGDGRDDLVRRMRGSNRNFCLFGVAVLGEAGDRESVPLLLDYLTDIDFNLADAAYESLRKITGLDPVNELGVQRNDPEVVWRFREHYARNRKAR